MSGKRPHTVRVKGYVKDDGTIVKPYRRSKPDDSTKNNHPNPPRRKK